MKFSIGSIFLLLLAVFFTACSDSESPMYVMPKTGIAPEQVIASRPSVPVGLRAVQIGSQIWTTENLNVTRYRNGDVIPQVQDPVEWSNLTTGAWCYYSNNTANGVIYGKLYNGYAVMDSRGLAPQGWHIPNDQEWMALKSYLGTGAGVQLKSVTGWQNDGGGYNGTNTSGFTALPGGRRGTNGVFAFAGQYGYWWSTTQYAFEPNINNYWMIGYTWNFIGQYNYYDFAGKSVRCIKD